MIEAWVWMVLFLGAALVLGGVWMIRRAGSTEMAGGTPGSSTEVVPVDEQRWILVVVQLALRVSRSDGALEAGEISTIEEALTGGAGGLDRAEAKRLVGLGLRSTIQPSGVEATIDSLAEFASEEQQDWILSVLERVARVDGTVTDEERVMITRVREGFGRV